jgi:hypothetical protein
VTFFTAAEIEKFNSGQPIRGALLCEMDFASQKMGAWNGSTKLTVNGTEFLPLFGAGTIDGLSFQNSTVSKNITITVAGVKNDILGLALASAAEVQNRLVTIYWQLFDDNWQPIAAPPAIFFGYMQSPEVTQDEVTQDGNNTSPTQTISVPAENIWFNRSRAPGGRYTDRDQQIRSPGDKIFDFAPGLVFKNFYYPDF